MNEPNGRLRFGIYAPNFGVFADPDLVAGLARLAERRGWDGWFIWDSIAWERELPFADPWVTLAAVAGATRRLRIGPLVTPLPRRRPWDVARACVTLDHLSKGRMVLGAGLGGDWYRELSSFGEELDPRRRSEMLDEALDLIEQLWRAERVSFTGHHYRVDDVRFLPRPLQRPRIPIWIASVWPSRRPLLRAGKWDGVVPIGEADNLEPDQVAELVKALPADRSSGFEIAVPARSPEGASERRAVVERMAACGATWWLESLLPSLSASEAEALISAGPPGGG